MCALALGALVLSSLGALAQRLAAALLGVSTQAVLGIGPAIGAGARGGATRRVEVRAIPLWLSIVPRSSEARVGRAILALACGPTAILLVPFALAVALTIAAGIHAAAPGPGVRVGGVLPDLPAEETGIATGDVITSVEGETVSDLDDLSDALRGRGEIETRIVVARDGTPREHLVVPVDADGRGVIGIEQATVTRTPSFGEATWLVLRMVPHLWSAALDPPDEAELLGPVAMARIAARTARPRRIDALARLSIAWAAFAPIYALVGAIVSASLFMLGRRRT